MIARRLARRVEAQPTDVSQIQSVLRQQDRRSRGTPCKRARSTPEAWSRPTNNAIKLKGYNHVALSASVVFISLLRLNLEDDQYRTMSELDLHGRSVR